ncbi:MAG: hypothetical protein LQ339_000370 [Xanthoria mediterranea]|nr:MAG: hypothetical protein LQ339_000370 [Xanthoria mediterranea]
MLITPGKGRDPPIVGYHFIATQIAAMTSADEKIHYPIDDLPGLYPDPVVLAYDVTSPGFDKSAVLLAAQIPQMTTLDQYLELGTGTGLSSLSGP